MQPVDLLSDAFPVHITITRFRHVGKYRVLMNHV